MPAVPTTPTELIRIQLQCGPTSIAVTWLAGQRRRRRCDLAARDPALIRIDAVWLATTPLICARVWSPHYARVVQAFGSAKPLHAIKLDCQDLQKTSEDLGGRHLPWVRFAVA
jgi:hypothetical protein